MESILNYPAAGLNEYTPSNSIGENHLSDVLDVKGYREHAIMFNADTTGTRSFIGGGTNEGKVVGAIESEFSKPQDDYFEFYGMSVKSSEWNLFISKHTLEVSASITKFEMTVPSVPSYSAVVDVRFSKSIFRTEANVFYCFTSSLHTRLHYVKYNYEKETNEYGFVDLPFYPASMTAHANRLFIIDTKNKVWWCKAGDLFSWYSMEYDDDAIMAESTMGNKTHTITGQPNVARVFTATSTSTDTPDTRGKLTITGTNVLGNALTATLTLYEGRVQTAEAFLTIDTVVQSEWTQNGATPDKIEFGVGPVGSGYVVDDAGFWTLDGEPYVFELFTLANALYISAGVSLYAFRGYSYENFSLQKIVSNLGNPNAAVFGYKNVAAIRNTIYFRSGAEIYEFNGESAPEIISRPVYINGNLVNGILGGIDLALNFSVSDWVLESDTNNLYVYTKQANPSIYYRFNYETRTWWKHSGWSKDNFSLTDNLFVRLVPRFDNDNVIPFIWTEPESGENSFAYIVRKGIYGITQGSNYPYVVTKSYQTSPSQVGTLTSIILAVKSEKDKTADIEVSFDTSENSTEFTRIWSVKSHIFTGDLEILEIPLAGSSVVNQHHYRLKISVSNMKDDSPVYLYNFERRFRVRGYSR